MNWRTSYLLFNISLGVSLLLLCFSLLLEVLWVGVVGLIIFFTGLLQTTVFYRCPYCGRSFNIRGRKPSYCPECGEPLDL